MPNSIHQLARNANKGYRDAKFALGEHYRNEHMYAEAKQQFESIYHDKDSTPNDKNQALARLLDLPEEFFEKDTLDQYYNAFGKTCVVLSPPINIDDEPHFALTIVSLTEREDNKDKIRIISANIRNAKKLKEENYIKSLGEAYNIYKQNPHLSYETVYLTTEQAYKVSHNIFLKSNDLPNLLEFYATLKLLHPLSSKDQNLKTSIERRLFDTGIALAEATGRTTYLHDASYYGNLVIHNSSIPAHTNKYQSVATRLGAVKQLEEAAVCKPRTFSQHMKSTMIDTPKAIGKKLSAIGIIAGAVVDLCCLGIPALMHYSSKGPEVDEDGYKIESDDAWPDYGFAYLGRNLVEYSARILMAPIGATIGLLSYVNGRDFDTNQSYSREKVKQEVAKINRNLPIKEKSKDERFANYNQPLTTIERDFPLFRGFRNNLGNALGGVNSHQANEVYGPSNLVQFRR